MAGSPDPGREGLCETAAGKRGLAVALGIQDRVPSGLTASDCERLRRLILEIEQASAENR